MRRSLCPPTFALEQVYVGNYEYDADERELERTFEKYGKVDRVEWKSGALGTGTLPLLASGSQVQMQGSAIERQLRRQHPSQASPADTPACAAPADTASPGLSWQRCLRNRLPLPSVGNTCTS